jgi:hypothetical protein
MRKPNYNKFPSTKLSGEDAVVESPTGTVVLLVNLLEEYVLHNKQHSKYIHHYAQSLMFAR